MLKIASASAALLLLAPVAMAKGGLAAGNSADTLEFVSVTNDNGACAAQGVKTGVVEQGIANGVKLGAGFSVSSPIPTSQGVADQVCQYTTAIPANLVAGVAQPYTGTTNCSLGGVNYQIVTPSGQGTIEQIDANSFTVNASSQVELNGTVLCDIQTSQLFIHTGK